MTDESRFSRADPAARPRPVRSYVLRAGRATEAQRRALAELAPRYGVEGGGILDARALYGRRARWVIEIGFGNGDALLELASAHPEWDFLGIEVHPPGVGSLLQGLDRRGLRNVRVVREDATAVLEARLPAASVGQVNLWFPDPWPKTRHHKRRIVQPRFVAEVARILESGGRFHLATDWADYARHMLEVLEAEPRLENAAGPWHYQPDPAGRPVTRFHARGSRLGHGVWDLIFVRRA
jgi:tRNA (guanine-N7-)-methyltransferase